MNGVYIYDQRLGTDKSLESCLKRLHKLCDPVLSEFKRRRFYEKPCDKRKRKRNSAIVARRRNEQRRYT